MNKMSNNVSAPRLKLKKNFLPFLTIYKILGIQTIDLSSETFKHSKIGVLSFVLNISYVIYQCTLLMSRVIKIIDKLEPSILMWTVNALVAFSFSLIFVVKNFLNSKQVYKLFKKMENLDEKLLLQKISYRSEMRFQFLLLFIMKNLVFLKVFHKKTTIPVFLFVFIDLFLSSDIFAFFLYYIFERIKSINNHLHSSKKVKIDRKTLSKILVKLIKIIDLMQSIYKIQVIFWFFSVIPLGVLVFNYSFRLIFNYKMHENSEKYQILYEGIQGIGPYFFQGHLSIFLSCLVNHKIKKEFEKITKYLKNQSSLKSSQIYQENFKGLKFMSIKLDYETFFQLISIEFTYFLILLQFITSINK